VFVPMLKLEVEYYKVSKSVVPDLPNTLTAAVKFRPDLGRLAPYGVLGVGAEFDRFTLHSGEYNKISFIGGGVHLFLTGMVSIRGDIRFLHYKGYNRTRYTAGLFIHI
jgi:hypothetical protein